MSLLTGGRLQAAGQVRNSYNIIHDTLAVPLNWTSGTASARLSFPSNWKLPFDIGPDKSSKVYLYIGGGELILSADSFVGNPTLDGILYYAQPNEKKIALLAVHQQLAANVALSVERAFIPEYAFNADAIDNLGSLVFENIASALGGTATFIRVNARINIGFYGIYSEPDYDVLNRVPPHEHSGLPWGIDIQDD